MKKCKLPISVTKLPRTSVRKSLVTSWSMKKCCRYANLWVRTLHLYTVGPLPTPNSGPPRCLVYLSLINFNFCPETSTFNFRTLFTCCDNHWLLSTKLRLAVTSPFRPHPSQPTDNASPSSTLPNLFQCGLIVSIPSQTSSLNPCQLHESPFLTSKDH